MQQNQYLGNYDRFGIHINNNQILSRNNQVTKFSPIMQCICLFTTDDYMAHLYYYQRGICLEKITHDKWKLIFPDEQVEFSRLSDLLPSDSPFSKHTLLNYEKRMRSCHVDSMRLLPLCNGKIVTGYVDSRKERGKIIHSWIETARDNVFDCSNNLAISKQDYYRYMHPEVINIISKEEYFDDCTVLTEIPICDKVYCLFRNEILESLNNTHLINEEEAFQKKLI